jgi:hypothetical protein
VRRRRLGATNVPRLWSIRARARVKAGCQVAPTAASCGAGHGTRARTTDQGPTHETRAAQARALGHPHRRPGAAPWPARASRLQQPSGCLRFCTTAHTAGHLAPVSSGRARAWPGGWWWPGGAATIHAAFAVRRNWYLAHPAPSLVRLTCRQAEALVAAPSTGRWPDASQRAWR